MPSRPACLFWRLPIRGRETLRGQSISHYRPVRAVNVLYHFGTRRLICQVADTTAIIAWPKWLPVASRHTFHYANAYLGHSSNLRAKIISKDRGISHLCISTDILMESQKNRGVIKKPEGNQSKAAEAAAVT
jgi:hypothetical protein